MRRELGVMALSALVVVFLALRAAGVKSLLTRTLPRAQYWREMLTQEDH